MTVDPTHDEPRRNIAPSQELTLPILALLLGCFACALLDGYDVVVVSYVIPELARTWSAPLGSFGLAFSSGLAGLVFGSLILAPLADRHGRRVTMIVAVFGAAVTTLANAWVTSVPELILCRFFVGISMGVITALVIAIAYEAVSGPRLKVIIATIVGCGLSLGNLASGVLASLIIPRYGWQSLFVGAAMFAALVGLVFAGYLHDEPVGKTAAARAPGSRVAALLSRDLAPTTMIIWLLHFGGVGANYMLLSWLPSLLSKSGYSTSQAAVATSLISFGGLIGGLVSGMLLSRFGKKWLLVNYLLAFALIALMPFSFHSSLLYAMNSAIGFCIVGGYICNSIVTSQLYPTPLRASGLGWAQGIGRTGSIATPLLVSFALQLNASMQHILLIAAFFPVLSAAAVVLLMVRTHAPSRKVIPAA